MALMVTSAQDEFVRVEHGQERITRRGAHGYDDKIV
jgi:hypothetical protein